MVDDDSSLPGTIFIPLLLFSHIPDPIFEYAQEFRDVGSSLVTVFNWLNGGVDLKIFSGSHNPTIGVLLLLLYWFTMSMVLLNYHRGGRLHQGESLTRSPRSRGWSFVSSSER